VRKLAVIAWLFAGWGLCATQPATACRYNVRDTGFVDLGASYYEFAWTGPVSAPGNLLSESDVEKLKPSDSLREALRDTNLLFLQKRSAQETPPGATSQPPADDENPAVQITIAAPDGRELSLPCPGDVDSLAMVARLVDSPLQRELIDRLLNCHSVVLLVEGVDEAKNKAARDLIKQTLEETQKASALWPKPIDHPPEMALLPQSEKNKERLLLWCLEVDTDVPDPQFVVLFGRGRKLGPVLTLDEVHAGELSGLLSVISMDCECEYNVAPLVGPMIPHRWTTEHEAQVARLLDFDPGNPLVQSEVRHILTRGPGNGRSILEARTDPALGYEEISFPDDLISTPETDNPTTNPETGLAAGTGGTTVAMTTTKPPESPVASPPAESPVATPESHSLDDENETIATTSLQNGIWFAVVMVALVAIIGSVVILRSATR
jgi:hypothetical protein